MLPTRVRFQKNSEGLLQSARYQTLNEFLTVYIDLAKVRYYIKNQDDVLRSSGGGKSKTELLPKIKNDLRHLGVKFSDEIRRRSKKPNGGIYERASDDLPDNVLVSYLRSGQ